MAAPENKLEFYHWFVGQLAGIVTSDVVQLKRLWEEHYNRIIALAGGETEGLYRHLIAHKDFLKDMCLTGRMEEYHAKRVCCQAENIYRAAWREQLHILAGLFQETGNKDFMYKADMIRERMYVYGVGQAALQGLARRYFVRPGMNGYVVEAEDAAGGVLTSTTFATLPAALEHMREQVFAALHEAPESFTL